MSDSNDNRRQSAESLSDELLEFCNSDSLSEEGVREIIAAEAEHTLPRYADHTYHDFSTYIDDGGKIEKHKKSDRNFPARLHVILSDEQYSNIISWMPHGRAWKVLNKKLLVEEVIPKFFGQSKFASFARQLSGWGFKRLHNTGPDVGCYYHECFLRGHPRLTVIMKRISPGQSKATPNKHSEPDFNTIAKLYPPEKSADAGKKETAAAVPRMESSQPNHQRDPYYQRGPTTPPHQAAYAYADPVGQYHSSSSSGVAPIETTVTNPNYLDSHIFSSVHQDQAHQEDDTNQYYYERNINQYAGRSPHSGHFSRLQYHYSQQQQHDGHSDKKFQNAHGDRNSYHSNYSSAQGLIEGNIQPIGSSGGTEQMRMSYPAQAQGIQARNSFLPSFSPIKSNFQEVEEGATKVRVRVRAPPFPTRGDTNVPTFAGLPSTSFGPTKMIHSTGTRMVPSQREELANEDNVNAEINICGDSNAKDLPERFLPRYETICKYAEACGDDGIQVMAKHFDHCQRRFLHFIHNSNVSDNDVAVQNPYHNFKLPYERICAMAQRGGDLGIDAASEEFAACLEELVALADERHLCTQKVNARHKKVTSPRRSAKKQPRR